MKKFEIRRIDDDDRQLIDDIEEGKANPTEYDVEETYNTREECKAWFDCLNSKVSDYSPDPYFYYIVEVDK